jgi:hypothetical protein
MRRLDEQVKQRRLAVVQVSGHDNVPHQLRTRHERC